MKNLRLWLKKIRTPVTIMVVPHSRYSSRSIKLPVALIAAIFCLSSLGVVYTISLSVHAVDYFRMKRNYASMNREFKEMAVAMSSLKQSESQFRRLFSLGSKTEVLADLEVDENGSIDVEALKQEIAASTAAVKEIRTYLAREQDVFRATPLGWPAEGRISSVFGMRDHPKYRVRKMHTGLDISLPRGTPLRATADGVVSFADRSTGNGNVVVLEHGHGFSTVYAHNTRNLVHSGQTVKRGDVIAYSGSTGVSTGPHLHYEVWTNGRSVDPAPYVQGK